MRSRVAFLAVLVLLLAAAIAGCGGSSGNGVSSKSPDAIVAAATNAVHDVKTVHVSGSLMNGGTPITLDLNLVAGKGGAGEMSQSGLGFRIVSVDQKVYIYGSDAFWRHFGGSAASLLDGKWLSAPATGQFSSIASLADVQTLFSRLLSGYGTLTKGGYSSVGGQKVVAVHDKTKGGTLYVATTGKPYPVEISKPGSQGGHIVFQNYNKPVSLSAPANSIDITKLP